MPRFFVFICVILLCLQGCVDTAVSGAQAVYNRSSIKKSFNDRAISNQAYQRIYNNTMRYKNTSLAFTTFNGVLLITGQVPNAQERTEIENIVKTIPNVEKVYNFSTVTELSSNITDVSDAWITTKIRSKLIATEDFDPNKVKVVTENGTVYLMGMVLQDEADTAAEAARTTDGVQSVVKIFTYLRISKT